MRNLIAVAVALVLVVGFGVVRDGGDGQDLDARTGMVAFGPDVTEVDLSPEARDKELNDQYGVPPMPTSLPDVESVVSGGKLDVPLEEIPVEFFLRPHLGNFTMSPLTWETRGGVGMEPWQMMILFGEMSEGSDFLDEGTQIFEMSFVLPLSRFRSVPPLFREEFFLPIPFDPFEVQGLEPQVRDCHGDIGCLMLETMPAAVPIPEDEDWRCYPCDHLRGYPGLK